MTEQLNIVLAGAIPYTERIESDREPMAHGAEVAGTLERGWIPSGDRTVSVSRKRCTWSGIVSASSTTLGVGGGNTTGAGGARLSVAVSF
jgi:hypothetical protein